DASSAAGPRTRARFRTSRAGHDRGRPRRRTHARTGWSRAAAPCTAKRSARRLAQPAGQRCRGAVSLAGPPPANHGCDPCATAPPADALLELFRQMLFLRTFDGKAVALQRTGKLGTYAPCLGHEATQIGIGAMMRPEDVLAPSYREYGTQIMRGVQLREILLYWGGDERGNDYQNEPARHDFPWAVPIATQCLHAAGAALAFKLRGEKRVAVTCCGDGGSSKADTYAAINAAGAYTLPFVQCIINNGWAISVPRSAQTGARTLAQKG